MYIHIYCCMKVTLSATGTYFGSLWMHCFGSIVLSSCQSTLWPHLLDHFHHSLRQTTPLVSLSGTLPLSLSLSLYNTSTAIVFLPLIALLHIQTFHLQYAFGFVIVFTGTLFAFLLRNLLAKQIQTSRPPTMCSFMSL